MDPVGSWSAYQSAYNRISAASAFSTAEFQHLSSSAVTSAPSSTSTPTAYSTNNGQLSYPTSTNQSFVQHSTNNSNVGGPSVHPSNFSSTFNPNSFLSTPSVGHYDPVVPPLYYPHATKPSASYYRHPSTPKTIQTDSSANYHTTQNYIEQVNLNFYYVLFTFLLDIKASNI